VEGQNEYEEEEEEEAKVGLSREGQNKYEKDGFIVDDADEDEEEGEKE
jgi:hypothetical protein